MHGETEASDHAARIDDLDYGRETEDVLKRLKRLHLMSLPLSALARLDDQLGDQQRGLHAEAVELERSTMAALADARSVSLIDVRKAARRLARDSEHIDEQRGRVHDAHQELVLQDKLAAALGGAWRVQLLEGLVLALIFLVLGLLAYEFTVPDLSDETRRLIFVIDTLCCAVFLAEFALRYRHADDKRWFLRRYWIDLATSIPMPDALILRSGRLFRVARIARAARAARFIRALRVLRLLRVLLFFWRGMGKLEDVMNVRLMRRSLTIGLAMLVSGALLIHWAEAGAETTDRIGGALWWSFTTLVTGGYGDIHNPGSMAGQIVTALLVLAGMAVVGVFTATLTALLVGDESEEVEQAQRELDARVGALAEEIERLSASVERLSR